MVISAQRVIKGSTGKYCSNTERSPGRSIRDTLLWSNTYINKYTCTIRECLFCESGFLVHVYRSNADLRQCSSYLLELLHAGIPHLEFWICFSWWQVHDNFCWQSYVHYSHGCLPHAKSLHRPSPVVLFPDWFHQAQVCKSCAIRSTNISVHLP